MQDNLFDEAVRKKLDSFEPGVRADLWLTVAEQLDQQAVEPITKPLKTKKVLRWWSIAAMLAFGLGMGLIYVKQPHEVVYLSAKKEALKEEKDEIISSVPQENREVVENNGVVSTSPSLVKRDLTKKSSDRKITDPENKLVTAIESAAASTGNRPTIDNEVVTIAVPPYSERTEEKELQLVFLETPKLNDRGLKNREKKNFGIGEILNYVVGSVDHGDAKVLSFASDDEGTLKVAVDLKALKVKL